MDERIGHYRIMSELGRGGMGVVYKAHEESLNRFVAIKVLGEHLAADPSYVQRFLREAQSAARLSHPNIVHIHLIGEDAGRHYFVMEYVDGTSLQQLLRSRGRLPVQDAARLVLQAAAGLAAAHDQGVIHRDIKPANLLIDERGLVRIADFGLALLHAAASRLTATGMFMGTPGYLSPEQCMEKEIDHRTDIYSLGVTFYESLAGRTPFAASSPLALLRQIMEVEPPDVRELNPEVDEGTRAIVARMMAKNRDRRHPSCHELIAELQAHLDRLTAAGVGLGTGPPVVAKPVTPVASAATAVNHQPTVAVASGSGPAAPPQPPPQPPTTATPPPPVSAPVAAPVTASAAIPARSWAPLILIAAIVLVAFGTAVGALIVLLAPTDEEPPLAAVQAVPPTAPAATLATPTPEASEPVPPPAAAPAAPATPAPTATARIVVVTATPAPAAPAAPTATPAAPAESSDGELEEALEEALEEPGDGEPAAATRAAADEIASLIAELGSGDGVAEQRAAKILYRRHRLDPRVPEAAARALMAGHLERLDDERHVDAMAWLCNILGVSGNTAHADTLRAVAAADTHTKIKRFAAKNAGRLR